MAREENARFMKCLWNVRSFNNLTLSFKLKMSKINKNNDNGDGGLSI
jgi:hypothetical protein